MLRSWIEQPLISSQLINHRLNAVEALVRQTMVRGDLTEELHYIADLERLMTRTVYGSATPKEIYTLAQTCDRLPGLRKQAEGCNCPELAELAASIDPLEDIKARIYAAVDGCPLHPQGWRCHRQGLPCRGGRAALHPR